MPKRNVAEIYIHFSSLIINLVPPEAQSTARKYFDELSEELKITTTVNNKRPKIDKEQEIFKKIESYLAIQTIPIFSPKEDDFVSAEASADIILKLIETEKTQHNTLLRSGVWQGFGLKKIASVCENQKIFKEKLKHFQINYSLGYCYFLIRLYTLIAPQELFLNSGLPISFIRKNFKHIENYISSKIVLSEKMTFGAQPQPSSQS